VNALTRWLGPVPSLEGASHFTPDHFRALLGYPTWNKFRQIIVYPRSYAQGLQIAVILLEYLQDKRSAFLSCEISRYESLLYSFVLAMLDRLDRWDDYLRAWHWIRENTDHTNKYSKMVKTRQRIIPFIINEDTTFLNVHFLYNGSHRKELIERKAARRDSGKPTGNLMHEQQCDLNDTEVRERFDWILRFVQTAEYDFDPPASRHRAARVRTSQSNH